MGITRWVDCPQCGRRVRLTAEELESKRGFCASCDARFELGEETHLGDGPGRELVHVPTHLALARPPSKHLVVHKASPLEVELRSRRSAIAGVIATGGVALLVPLAIWTSTVVSFSAAFPLWILLPFVAAVAWEWWRPSRDFVAVYPGRIEIRRGRRPVARLAVDDRSDIAVAHHALVVTTDETTVEVGVGFGLHPDELRWLRNAIRSAARSLPGTDPDPDAAP